jgi:Sec-independent protein translocase protein TatA
MSNAEGLVVPKPGTPKTLGILNIIFGVILVLMGTCQLGALAIAPAALNFIEKNVKEVQAKADEQHKAELKTVDDKIAAAKTEEEKKAFELERANVDANKVQFNTMDMSTANEALTNPTIKAVNIGGTLSGLILHIGLLVSGIGLIRLTPWGRSLALWWSGLIIVQVIGLAIATMIWAVPVNSAISQKQIANLEAQAKAGGPQAQMASTIVPMTKLTAQLVVPMIIGQSIAGIIYPIVLLIMLNGAGARAACLEKAPKSFDDLTPDPI